MGPCVCVHNNVIDNRNIIYKIPIRLPNNTIEIALGKMAIIIVSQMYDYISFQAYHGLCRRINLLTTPKLSQLIGKWKCGICIDDS